MVLDHQEDGPLIDAEVRLRKPVPIDIVRIAKAVRAPEGRIFAMHRPERSAGLVRSEGDGAARRRGRDGAVVVLRRRRSTRAVAVRCVGGGEAPLVLSIVGISSWVRRVVGPLRERRTARGLEVDAAFLLS